MNQDEVIFFYLYKQSFFFFSFYNFRIFTTLWFAKKKTKTDMLRRQVVVILLHHEQKHNSYKTDQVDGARHTRPPLKAGFVEQKQPQLRRPRSFHLKHADRNWSVVHNTCRCCFFYLT